MSGNQALPETIRTILNRRSCRAFYPEPLPEAHVQVLLEAVRWAPSAGNRQPWHVFVVLNKQVREELADAAYGQEFLARAPVVFVMCAIPFQSASRYGLRGETLYVYQDTAAAVQNLLLAATALGYGSCWVGAFDERWVREVLELPAEYRPVALVPVGLPAEEPEPPERRPLKEIATFIDS